MKKKAGFSLFEILVVLTIFAILAIVSSQSVLLTLKGARKSDAISKVKQNLDYAMAVIERQTRSAGSISPCPNPDTSTISLIDQNDQTSTFSCINTGTGGYLASSSARLTSSDLSIINCSFVCNPSNAAVPISVSVSLTGQDANTAGAEGSQVNISTTIYLRSF